MNNDRTPYEIVINLSSEDFSNAFHFATIGMALVSTSGKCLRANKSLCDMLGYTNTEMMSFTFHDITYPEDLLADVLLFERLEKGEIENYTIEKRYFTKSQEIIWANLNVSKVIYPDGSIKHFISQIENITERRTADDNERKMLLSKNRELEQFASIASHDMKEPLRMIQMFMQLLEEKYADQLDERARKYINFAVNGSKRLTILIEELLRYATIGSNIDQAEKINTNDLVSEIVTLHQDIIDEKGGSVECGSLPEINGYKVPLKLLFQNLISNAFKYQEPGAIPKVKISAELKDNHYEFAVSDNGIGISSEYYEYIFQLFKRLHSKDKYPGTGLGLAMCKRIVEQHRGNIWVKSVIGEGSTFYFTIRKEI